MLFQHLGSEETPTTATASMAVNGPLNLHTPSISQRRKSYYDVSTSALKATSTVNPNDMFAKYIQQSCIGESTFIEPSADEENFRDYTRRLDTYYKLVSKTLIENQSATTGLFPIYGNTSQQNTYAHVRDNVYCALTIWALRQSYFKIDNDNGRTHELGQCAVKCMRGILYCWLKDASKVEKFKSNPAAENALPVKFHIRNAGDIEERNYGHLQIDCVSLYLLYLAQMIASGLQIIYSKDEVDLIQNLIFYVERAYRTPDYGIWERGSKYNINECELNAR
jgi:phosphorylase kinase alpha/beta subunit